MNRITSTLALAALAWPLVAAEPALVADPGRAIRDAGWKPAMVCGRDYWQLLSTDLPECMPEITNVAFYSDGGRRVARSTIRGIGGEAPVTKHNPIARALAVREVRILTSSGSDLSPAATFRPEPVEQRTQFRGLKALNDGDDWTTFIARGDRSDARTKFLPVSILLHATLRAPTSIAKVIIEHGAYQDVGRIREINVRTHSAGEWREVARKDIVLSDRRIEAALDVPLETDAVRFDCCGWPFLLRFNEQHLPEREHLKTHPFYLSAFIRANRGDVFSLTSENFDHESFRRFQTDYHDSHLGFYLPEWDSNIKGMLRRPYTKRYMPEYMKTYRTKDQGAVAWSRFFGMQKELLFGEVFAHSGNIYTVHYPAAWGAKTVAVQTSGMSTKLPVRCMLMAMRGGCRQFGNTPWKHYQAFFAGLRVPQWSCPYDGKPLSQVRRELFASYYMGANFQEPEGARNAMLCGEPGQLRLSPVAKVYQQLYHWHQSKKGERGESYTPLLFLVDYNHGHTGRRWQGPQGDFKAWQHLPFDDGDYMHEHFVRTVDKFIDFGSSCVKLPPYSANIVNSKIGDICDLFFANPPQHGGVVKREHLDKYPVVIPLGAIRYNDALTARLKRYVEDGGTLVINAAQCEGPLNNPEFLGLTVVDGQRTREPVRWQALKPETDRLAWQSDSYEIMPVQLGQAEVMTEAPKSQLPLLTRHRVGKGHVIVTTPYFMLLKNRETPHPLIEELLVDLQREMLPIQVRGDIHFLMNKITPDHWKVVLLNNKGILKHPQSREVSIRKYRADVLLTVRGTVAAKDILKGEVLDLTKGDGNTYIGLTVEPGDVKVVDVVKVEARGTGKQ